MSIKGFHLFFVSICLLLFAFFVVWGFVLAPDEKAALARTIGATGIIGLLLIPFYAVYFLRKIRRNHL